MTDPGSEAPRKYPRQRTLKGARIQFDGLKTYDVTVRDMSEGGVKLKLGSPFAAPHTFLLIILNPNTGISQKRACELRWQRGDQIGAQFVDHEPAAPVTKLAAAGLRRTAAPD
jgi:hypothetical protein